MPRKRTWSFTIPAPLPFFTFLAHAAITSATFSFGQLTPSKDIKWTPRVPNLTCTKFEVLPSSEESNGTTATAIMRWSADTRPAKEILIEPSGLEDIVGLPGEDSLPNLFDRFGPIHILININALRGSESSRNVL